MEKLTLPLDQMKVESFEVGEVPAGLGTVHARQMSGAGGGCCTKINTGCNPDITNVATGACVC